MKKYTLLLLILATIHICSAQTLKLEQENIALLGATQLEDKVIILSRPDKAHVALTSVDMDGTKVWSCIVEVPSIGGYNFNQLQILGDEKNVWLIQQHTKQLIITSISPANGEIYETRTIKRKSPSADNNVWQLVAGEPKMYSAADGMLIEHLSTDGKLKGLPIVAGNTRYPADKYTVHFSKGKYIYSSNRVMEPNHGLMHLYLEKTNAETKDTLTREIELELAHTSFTYSSSVDKNIYGMVPSETGFYLIGKLDIAFKKRYPTDKVGDNCIGFWVAKFKDDLTLDYFKEIPFQYLDHIVDADVVQLPSIIDIKEDANGGLFININEMPGVIYHKKYFVYLSATGNIDVAKGGKDEYHYLEYDRTGLRNAGRKSNVRLMNDNWSPYVNDAFLYLSEKEEYSPLANSLFALDAQDSRLAKATKGYTFFYHNGKGLILMHTERKGGTLKVYTP